MVSTPKEFTNDSPISPMTSTSVKKPRAQKSLWLFTSILYMKKKCFRQVGAAKSKPKAIKLESTPWALKKDLNWN